MLALALIAASGVFGWGVVRRLDWSLTRVEAIGLAGAVACTLVPWLALGLVAVLGFTAGLMVTILFAGTLGVIAGRRPAAAIADLPTGSALSWCALAAVLALGFHGHMLHEQGGALWSGGSSYGDVALHATLANHFAANGVDLRSPIISGSPLTYPFLGDFVAACLVRGGWSLSMSLAVSGWLTAMLAFALIHAVAVRLWRSRAAGVIAVWTIVLSGSLAGLYYFATDLAGRGWPDELRLLPSYANDRARGLVWSNTIADFVLPQRAYLSAMPAAWAAVWALRAAVDDDRPRARLVAAVAIGASPWLHIHAFLVLAGLLLLCASVETLRRPRTAVRWWMTVAAALILAAPQLVWQLGGTGGAGFGRWRLGWLAPDGGFWWFWLRNWGVALVLVPVVAVMLVRRRRFDFAAQLLIAAVGLFAAANLYQFQPHDWDNMKFFIYAFAFVAVLGAGALAQALRGHLVVRATAGLALVGLTATGALTLARELDLRDEIASAADQRIAARVRAVVPPDALVLTADRHNHPVSMLAGRRIVMGYRGWLWTHGYETAARHRAIHAMFAGDSPAPRLLREAGITHVYIGHAELHDYHANLEWYRQRYVQVLDLDGAGVFDVRRVVPERMAARRP